MSIQVIARRVAGDRYLKDALFSDGMGVTENLLSVRARIQAASVQAGRSAEEITLVAVTKQADITQIREALNCGITAFGENRVLEAIERLKSLSPVEKHMLGHLQTNKVKAAVQFFDCIQSVDSLKLAKEIDKQALSLGKLMPVMIEVKFEEQKQGIEPDEIEGFYNSLIKLTNIKVIGLMTMAPYVPAEQTRPYFQKMKKLNERLGLRHLSMGTSNDFEVAIEEGSTMVRIGSAIFGTKQ